MSIHSTTARAVGRSFIYIACVGLGIAGVLTYERLSLYAALPASWRGATIEGMPNPQPVGQCGRFYVVMLGPVIPGVDPTTYSVHDKVTGEWLATFKETAKDAPFTVRTFFRPAETPTDVATVVWDNDSRRVTRVVCSPGQAVFRGQPSGEAVYDTNMDGIWDRLVGTASTPDPLLLRTPDGWKKAKQEGEKVWLLMNGEWQPAHKTDAGLWVPTEVRP